MVDSTSPFTSKSQLVLTYGLFAAGVLIGPLAVAAAIWAYVQRSRAQGWQVSHFQYLIRTFWWTLGLMVLSAVPVLFKLTIGVYFVVLIKLWVAYRLIAGVVELRRNQAIID